MIQGTENPTDVFLEWFEIARNTQSLFPEMMVLSTVSKAGRPRNRAVLLKQVDRGGFVFFSNYRSRKGRDLDNCPYAALNFTWLSLERQVSVEGEVVVLSEAESDLYWKQRPRGSQLGAWASSQSTPIGSREEMIQKYRDQETQYEGRDVPRPAHWGGYRLLPVRIEFWLGKQDRFHDRFVFQRDDLESVWVCQRLQP
jgi:pyridoxamine 5'-phosphate oxidase